MMRIIWMLTVALLGCGDQSETKAPAEADRWEGQFAGECSDEADNDRDGLFDCDDSDCAGAPNCGDDAPDLDADGTTDADSDVDGGAADDTDSGTDAGTDADGSTGAEIDDFEGDEPGECGDGIDNDRDGIFDCTDPGCSTAPECTSSDSGTPSDADGLPPGDSDGADDDGGGDEASACDEEEESTEVGEGEMEVRGWLTISGDVDLSSASCRITTWPWSGISPTTGTPDLGGEGGVSMLGDACIDCPGVVGTAVPFTVIVPVGEDGAEVGVIAKVNADGRIYEQGTDANPLTSMSAGDAEGFRFELDVVEPGPDDPLDPPDAGADLEPPDGPDAEPDMGAPGSGG